MTAIDPSGETGSGPHRRSEADLPATELALPSRLAAPAHPSKRTALFRRGQRVAERYRIVRFVALGGMGEVYEAEDEELETRIALKTLRPEVALSDPRAAVRFKREIRLARQIAHPNVCRIFDLGHHRPPGCESIPFLTMEFLPGETLTARLRRSGRMGAAEALPLVRQMAEGLSAAHRAGIVHRDFKSGNVMLVPDPLQEGGLRAVVTDFGIARTESSLLSGSGDSTSGEFLGTHAYMAPEQFENRPVTPATDLYAFGIVLFEMVTGSCPLTGDSLMATAAKRLAEPPPSPRRHVPSLSRKWETAILRCLERDPERRFAGAREVAAALSAGWRMAAFRRGPVLALAALLQVMRGGW